MREVKSEENWCSLSKVDLKDEDGNSIVSFEDESNVLGTKICVYDAEGKELFFLDEEVTEGYDMFNIQKDAETVARIERGNNLVHREIKITAKGQKYNFMLLHSMLMLDGKKVAKLGRNAANGAIKMQLKTDENTEFILTLLYTIQILLLR